MSRTNKNDAPLAKSEVRHAKQKEKLEQKGNKVSENITYIPKKYFKVVVMEEAQKAGFNCFLNNGTILMFNENNYERVNNWMRSYFNSDDIPMSFGFSGSVTKGDSNE